MKKLLLPITMLALLALPGGAQASACRNAKGQFVKCGAPGALPAGQMKPAMAPAMKPAMAPAMKPAMAPAMKPAMAPAKKAPCKDAKGKFIKCAA